MEIVVEREWEGRTVKEYLYGQLRLSGAMITALKKKENGICLNGTRVTVRAVLHTDDHLSLEDTEDTASAFPAVEIPLDILYEDDDILVVNKPSGMPCHPSRGHYEDTLANAVLAHCKGRPFVFRAINRLDADTSGAVLIAKNRLAAYRLAAEMQSRAIHKEYLCVLDGILAQDYAILDLPICRREGSTMLRRIAREDEEGAQTAQTEYRVLWKTKERCGVLASPLTGRTHQLRVHFSSQGAPILYDPFYGTEVVGKRLCLHAWRITFTHPTLQKQMTLCAPMPRALQEEWKEEIPRDQEILSRA